MTPFPTPSELRTKLPLTPIARTTVDQSKNALIRILSKQDDRLVVVVGPCSIHDPRSALRYAEKLRKIIDTHQDGLCIVMRAYVEKSRTALGWKGFVNDPDLNNSFQVEKGLITTRKLFLSLNEMGVPLATEIVHPAIASYYLDLISWAAIGARTCESQLHREFIASLDLPVGFKNNTNGDVNAALDAVKTARTSHVFVGNNLSGALSLIQASGNPHTHIVLRGSKNQPNFDRDTINQAAEYCPVFVDCSHGNSQKNPINQINVVKTLAQNLDDLSGIMLESFLCAGNQPWIPTKPSHSDISLTDPCLDWADTEKILDLLRDSVLTRHENLLKSKLNLQSEMGPHAIIG